MKRSWIVLGTLAGLVAVVLAVRTPLRKALRPWLDPKEPWSGRFPNPEGLCRDSDGNLYVGDSDRGEFFMLDPSGRTLAQFATIDGYVDGDGRPARFCRGLNMVAVKPRHLIAVAVHNVVEFAVEEDKPKLIRIIGRRGCGPGEMNGPEGLCRDVNGDLYVTDEHNRQIDVFDRDGRHLRSLDLPQDPQSVRVIGDRVYVALNKRNYIACYSKDGRELFRIGSEAAFPLFWWIAAFAVPGSAVLLLLLKRPKTAAVVAAAIVLAASAASLWDYRLHLQPGQFRLPDHMAPAPDGKTLFIADRANGRIQAVDLDGNLKACFGGYGRDPGRFRDPKDIVFDDFGNLIIADSDNHRLQVLAPDGRFLRVIH